MATAAPGVDVARYPMTRILERAHGRSEVDIGRGLGSDANGGEGGGAPTGDAESCAAALDGALGAIVLDPSSPAYADAMRSFFSPEASLRHPVRIVQPRDKADVVEAVRIARAAGCPVTVRGGGFSELSVADDAVMIDLSAHLNGAELIGDDVRVGGGATMGAALAALRPRSRVIPGGVTPALGLGLALGGGTGFLSRTWGLTLDHLRELELVVPSGDVHVLSGESRGDDAELWWAVRGCAPQFGVVTGATLSSRPLSSVFVQRVMLDLDGLPGYFDFAPSLPREISATLLVGNPPGSTGPPVLLLYMVYAGDDPAGIDRCKRYTREYVESTGLKPMFEAAGACDYEKVPPFVVPGLDGAVSSPGAAEDAPPEQRTFSLVKSFLLGAPFEASSAAGFRACIESAPTPLCGLYLQHCGGAVRDVPPTEMAFFHRDFEWNLIVSAAWQGRHGERDAAIEWVRETRRALAAQVLAAYLVDAHPELPEIASEVEEAFGGNLGRLRELKRRWDPDNVLRLYYPL